MRPLRLGVLGSGKGSNFAAILDAIADGRLDAEVRLVVSDCADARILDLARAAGIPARCVTEARFKTRLSAETETAVVEALRAAEVDLVVLAGYMRVVKEAMLTAFPRRIVNVHPSLLPAFRGLEAWRQAVEAGAKTTGCTVHLVNNTVDAGEILAQAEVPVLPDDTPESLHARIQETEHRLFPEVLATFAGGGTRSLVAS
jgi:phosphoribosylglycinamide formyltransferase-1